MKTLNDIFTQNNDIDTVIENIIRTFRPREILSRNKYDDAVVYIIPLTYDDIVFSPISQLKCIQCGFYGRTYYCGPWIPPYYIWRKTLSKMNLFLLIAGKIVVKEVLQKRLSITHSFRASYMSGLEGTSVIKSFINKYTIEIVKNLKPFARKVIAFDAGGGCRRCRKCNKHKGKPCKYPNEANVAPEASGIELYTILQNLFPDFKVPPVDTFWSVRLVVANIPELTRHVGKSHNITIPKPKVELDDAIDIINVSEVYEYEKSKIRCDNCEKYSSLICNRKWYKDEDLYKRIKHMNINVIKLKYPYSSKKAIDQLYSYQLDLHRKGIWWSFHLLNSRCSICNNCSIETHISDGYKKLTNRRIPFCVSYFNLNMPEYMDKNVGYILA